MAYTATKKQVTTSPGGVFVAVTPSDGTALAAGPTRGIYIGGTGNLAIKDTDGNTVTFTAIALGMIHPIQASYVMATNTTATLILAVY